MAGMLNTISRHAHFLIGGGVTVVGTWRLYSYTYGAPVKCEKQAFYGSIDKPLDPYLTQLIDEVAEKFLPRIPVRNFAEIRFYVSTLPDISHMGSLETKPGTYIGIPLNFLFKNASQLDLSDITSTDEKLLENLTQALLLTDQAKKFAIAQQIHSADTFYVLLKLMVYVYVTCGALTLTQLESIVVRSPYVIQLAICVALVAFWAFIGYIVEYAYEYDRVLDSDKKTVLLGEEYLDGGLEYLEKQLQRNRALRDLGVEGHTKCDEHGQTLKKPFELGHVPVQLRIDRIKKIKEDMEKSKVKLKEDSTEGATK